MSLHQAGSQQPGSKACELAEWRLPEGASVGWREQSRWLTGPPGTGFGHLSGDAGRGAATVKGDACTSHITACSLIRRLRRAHLAQRRRIFLA